MDKGTWIAVIVLVCAAAGFFLVQVIGSSTPDPSTDSQTQATSVQDTAPVPAATDDQSCQAVAAQAAQNDSGSVVSAYFNQQGQCYYELNISTASGNETSLRMAPSDQTIAACTTTISNTLSCQNQSGTSITEPQFKALLTNYLGS